MSAVNPIISSSRPLFGVLPLKYGSASFLFPTLSKQSFVGSSQRLSTNFGQKVALKAGKQPNDTPVEEEEEEEKEVVVRDPETDKTIECYVDQEITVEGTTYSLVYPCDRPVVIAYVDKEGDDEELVPLTDKDVEKIFPAAYKACAAEDVELVNSAVVMTLQGDLPDEDDEDTDVDYGDVEEDQELVRVFTTFEESGVEYVVTEPLDPVLIVVKPDSKVRKSKSAKPQFVLLTDDAELDKVMPAVNALLEEQAMEEEEASE